MVAVPVLVEQIDVILPQAQCGKCGYAACKPYAEAIVAGTADINQCPPGGETAIHRLAALLNRELKPLNPQFGVEKPMEIAVIDEQSCIGCTLCIDACPVDAILGAPKQMHAVITAYCTGCELCIPSCPVDCIRMIQSSQAVWSKQDADAARERFKFRNLRIQREQHDRDQKLAQKALVAAQDRKQTAIRRALERARTRSEASQK
ncbi:MAG TPA: RnfABCDGE type electron transport complex subunit B [Burkholderiales bacterium]|nr:RnfABCDGE type electron transport complex subunit B [Burkholderiales bacterium]